MPNASLAQAHAGNKPTRTTKIHLMQNKPEVYGKTEVEDLLGIAVLYVHKVRAASGTKAELGAQEKVEQAKREVG